MMPSSSARAIMSERDRALIMEGRGVIIGERFGVSEVNYAILEET
jgi:hypothetical protein